MADNKINRVLKLKHSKYLPHGVAAALSVIIIGVIVFAPAASALTVEILGAANNQKVGRSGDFKFVAHIKITSGELIPLQTLNIILNGQTFSFDPRTGEPIGTTSPAIVSVNPTNFPVGQLFTPSYGYTYGYFLGLNGSQYSHGYPYAYGYGVNGSRTINYLIVLDTSKMREGPNTIRLNVVTALSPVSTYWSSEVQINVDPKDHSKSDQVHGDSPEVDYSGNTSVQVHLTGAKYKDDSVDGTIHIVEFHAQPNNTASVDHDTGKKGVKWVDVKALGFTAGNATITLTYTKGEIASARIDENTLTLYYYDDTVTPNSWKPMSNIVRDSNAHTVKGDVNVGSLGGTYISLAGSTVSTGPATPPPATEPAPTSFPSGGGFVVTSTTATSPSTTSTTATTRTTVSSTTTKSSTSTSTTTTAATSPVTSTTTSTLQTTVTATSTSTAVAKSTATATVITTSVSTATKDVSTVVTAVKKSTETVTTGVTSTTVTISTFGSAIKTVTEDRYVGVQNEVSYAAITLAVASVVAAILLTARRPKQYVVD